MSTVISMLVGSKLSTKALVLNSIMSIIKNIGCTDYNLVVGVAPYVGQGIKRHLKDMIAERRIRDRRLARRQGKLKSRTKTKDCITIIDKNCHTFAAFTNHVFSEYASNAKWFIVAHDDICLKTKNFIPTVENAVSGLKENVGWISFTDDDYLNRHWAPSTRPGYHYDLLYENAWGNKQVFQFHSLTKGWLAAKKPHFEKVDFPIAPVKCHTPFSHFIMIETKKLKKIGLCEDWCEVSLLIDEDWGLSALKEGMFNVWIPNIIYTHCRTLGTRAGPIIAKRAKEVHAKFYKKWGFHSDPEGEAELEFIRKNYGNTNIVWSMGKRTFEWDYIK